MYPLPTSVVSEIERRFGDNTHAVIEQVQNMNLPLVSSPRLFARIVVAILYQSVDVDGVPPAIAKAEADWRDLLMATGLAHEDWPSVIEKNGISMDDWPPAQPRGQSQMPESSPPTNG